MVKKFVYRRVFICYCVQFNIFKELPHKPAEAVQTSIGDPPKLDSNRFPSVFGLVMGRRKITIWCQHLNDPQTQFLFSFWRLPFCF